MKNNTLIAILAASTLSQGCITISYNKPTEILEGTAKYSFNPNPISTKPIYGNSYSVSIK